MKRISHIYQSVSNRNVGGWWIFLPTFIFLSCFFAPCLASGSYVIPDFAFPKTAESSSFKALENNLKSKEYVLALRDVMNVCISRNLLNEDNVAEKNISLLDSVALLENGCSVNLTLLLEAEILKDTYFRNKNIYDSRLLPSSENYPDDPEEWNGGMFKTKVLQLVDSACLTADHYKNIPISDISILLNEYEESSKIGLSVYDFILFKGEEILSQLASPSDFSVIPFYPEEIKNSIEGRIAEKAKSLLDSLILNYSAEPPSMEGSVIRSFACLKYSGLLNDSQKKPYLEKVASEMKGSSGEGLILYELWNSDGRDNSPYYLLMKDWLQAFPEACGNLKVRYALAEMESQKVDVSLPNLSLPDSPIQVNVDISNIGHCFLLVYKLNSNQYDDYGNLILKNCGSLSNPVKTIELTEEKTVPFNLTKDIEISGLKPGMYAVIPSLSPKLETGWNKGNFSGACATFRVSDIAILTGFNSNQKDSGKAYVVQASDMKPVSGAGIEYFNDNRKVPSGKGMTNNDGWLKIPEGYYRLRATAGESEAGTSAGFSYYPVRESESLHASILSDLAIYRPGDSVSFVVVGWRQSGQVNTLIKNQKVKVTLFDVNYNAADSVFLTLNDEGRVNGRLKIPSDRLTGNYQLNVIYPDFPHRGGGAAFFQVENYKLPPFEVNLQQSETSKPGVFSFIGTARTFAGMPISDAKVEIEVNYIPWKWRAGNNASFKTLIQTDSEGSFSIDLPVDSLKGTPFEKGRYSVSASVTSSAGEAEKSKPLLFYLGKNIEIRPDIPEKTRIDGDSLKFKVMAYNMAGLPEKTFIEYRLINIFSPQDTVEGSFESPNLIIVSENLKEGRYRIEFKTPDQEEWTATETVLWSPRSNVAPYPAPLWVPQDEYVYAPGDKEVEIRFGSYWENWILFILSDGEKELEREWIKPNDGLITKKIKTPEKGRLFVNLAAMHDFQSASAQITLVPAKDLEKMEILAESFRDKINAGEKEEWKFIFKVGDKLSSEVCAMAVMSDKALNSLADFKWDLGILLPSVYSRTRINIPYLSLSSGFRSFSSFTKYPLNSVIPPSWETYGYNLMAPPYVQIYNLTARKTMSREATGHVAIMKDYFSAAEAMDEEASVEEVQSASQSDSIEGELRPVEMPLAFFKPDLKTTADGSVEIKFVVPDFNTTWQLQIAGYNQELLNDVLVLDAVASKPVMVKTSLPQFLRSNDKAWISATVFNNTEASLDAACAMEIFDPVSGTVYSSENFAIENLAPSASSVVKINVDVPDNIISLGVRTIASSGNSSDGEQAAVPVLPSSAPVVEALTFYGNMNEEEIEVTIPEIKPDYNVTLKYCDNPLWDVVLSLPGFREGNSFTSVSLMQRLYRMSMTRHILKTYPEISEGLLKILQSGDSLTSVSALQKNESLKITSLEMTPWVNDATSQTAGIQSLANYFDEEKTESGINLFISRLRQLQNSDGGWSWCEGLRSSEYITTGILKILGLMNSRGLLDSDMASMAKRAVGYCDSKWIERRKSDKRMNIKAGLQYFYVRSLFDFKASNELRSIEKETADSVANGWRYFNPMEKSIAILWLSKDVSKKGLSAEIANSLKEFSKSKLTLQEMAVMLEIFSGIFPDETVKDTLSQRLFLAKETEDWGDEPYAVEIINSLLASLSHEVYDRKNPEIFMGERLVTLPKEGVLTGNFLLNLTPSDSGERLIIKKSPGMPSWGGIISQYVAPIEDVREAKVENLSVSKQVYKLNDDGRPETVNTFVVGDKIIVNLTLNVGKDMDFVVISDSRSACMQPEERLSGIEFKEGLLMYRGLGKESTEYYIENLPAGHYVISYVCTVERSGEYSCGITEVQSLYAPTQVAHSAGSLIQVDF